MEQTNKRPLVILTGPTAVGKTAAHRTLPSDRRRNHFCPDSMQVYKEMDIGSAKIRRKRWTVFPHHLVTRCS